MNDSPDGPIALEDAAAAVLQAEQAVRAARKQLRAAIVAAYQNGEPVASIAARTGEQPHQIRNLLDATGVRARR
ncbi:hypothetical protein [Streptomyces chartreusis]|uniref:hypothetical protein n=1 Tax=Streptomyces chartreusis TaxID=1969 RepID=UPI0037FA03D9